MQRTKAALADHFYDCAMSAIADENYDIIDTDGGFIDTDFANAATEIFRNLLVKGRNGGWVFKKEPLDIYAMGFQWRIKNNMPGFVSCSDDNRTGVSRTESSIFLRIYGIDEDDVKALLDMMNEAWFLMANNA